MLRHTRTATTTDVNMQEIPRSVQATVDAINAELRKRSKSVRKARANVVHEGLIASQFGRGQSVFDTK